MHQPAHEVKYPEQNAQFGVRLTAIRSSQIGVHIYRLMRGAQRTVGR